ncbi:YaaR family protein [Jeotgalibacillus malaysiensis]|uniref:YaaR family protein n=1 Tax=Jeotgalibacillus malaysiensis TaxID=1508404 RepID=UPI00384F2346
MKINRDLRVGVNQPGNNQQNLTPSQLKFGELVAKQDQKLQSEQLTRLMGEVNAAGDRLARSRNFKDLAKFKMLVKRFVKETVEYGMNLKQSHSWNEFGEGRKLRLVETIDEKLTELTESVLKGEKESVDVLDQIGEIKGLLINIYT